ncbi:hypothetical protein BGZ80_009318 [Entomortierella chlamydospora]|uniref:Alcohol acetyltransferase n=1 Tax=Entomortierella chlamydospora TaxID=101097 RepID=A0A9P6T0K5_9FUNG|nr:hypothetical protein BGZ79_002972 [Entomortierella chlamydospora]KAG0016284.1 hypothetical protein BGZ80_009318 [Entomortierella chlamydospora]
MTLPVIREVYNLERYSLARANAGTYLNVAVGTRLTLQSKEGQLPKDFAQWLDLLTGPLTWLIQQHSALSVVIGDHLSANPMFLRLPSVDLAKIIRVTSINKLDEFAQVLEYEHAHPFDLTDFEIPLWRIAVVHVKEDDSFYLIYVFMHAIGDGRSAMSLSEQLVEQLNIHAAKPTSLDGKPSLPTVVTSPNDPLPLPMEERVNCDPRLFTLVKEAILSLLLPAFVKKAIEPKYWSGEVDATLEAPHDTRVGMWCLSKEETAQLTQASKAHKTTIQSILFTASCFAIKSVFLSKVEGSKATTTKDKLSYATPVALRPLISPPISPQDQGNYTSELVTKNIQIDLDTGFWDLTKSYREQIIKGTKTPEGVRGMVEHAGLLKYLPNQPGGWEDFLRGQVTKEQHGRMATLKLSNVGKAWDQPSPESVAFKVEEGIFSQSSGLTSSAFTLNAATANGVLSMIGTWQKTTFTSCDRAHLYMAEFKRILLEATEPGRKDYRFQETLLPLHGVKSSVV